MPVDFPSLLLRLLAERDLSGRQFGKMVKRSSGFITDVTKGRSAAPDNIEVWADALGLAGDQRTTFLLAAAWKRTPKVMQVHVESLEERISYLERPPSKRKRQR